MTPATRLLFDDCISKHAVSALQTLATFSGGAAEFAHLVDFNLSGQRDDDWIPLVAKAGWIVVSSDRGKKPTRGGKLPLLCQKWGLPYVLFSGAVNKRKTFHKMRAIFAVWPQLALIAPGPPSTGHLIRSLGDGDRVVLECIYPKPGENDPKVQQRLT